MRYVVRGFLAVAVLFGTARFASAGCDLNDPTTKSQVDAARAAADQACDAAGTGCTTAASHGQYVSCVAHQANMLAESGSLPKECKGAVKKCAARSTCGKPGFVTCCRTRSSGTTKCSTKSSASNCTDHAPAGGSACVGNHPSCCDACTDTGCAP